MKSENYTGIGAILSSFLIASCCIGPAIFVIFGTSLSFMGWFSVFEPYQGYFMALAAILLSVSFWKLYLKKSDCDCEEGGYSKRSAVNAAFQIIDGSKINNLEPFLDAINQLSLLSFLDHLKNPNKKQNEKNSGEPTF